MDAVGWGWGACSQYIERSSSKKFWYLLSLALFRHSTSARWPSKWESVVPGIWMKWRFACFRAHSMLFVGTTFNSSVSTFSVCPFERVFVCHCKMLISQRILNSESAFQPSLKICDQERRVSELWKSWFLFPPVFHRVHGKCIWSSFDYTKYPHVHLHSLWFTPI